MLSIVICFALIASPVLSDEMNAQTLTGFQGVFYQTIGQHLQDEYDLLQPAIAKQNATMEQCRSQILTAQSNCQSCAESSCRGSGNFFTNTWGAVDTWIGNAGNSFVDWQGWQDIGNAFDSVGDWFSDTFNFGSIGSGFNSAFGGVSNFFGGVGDVFSSGWNGFTNFMGDIGSGIGNAFSDLGSSIGGLFGRRRRSLRMSTRRMEMLRHRHLAKRMEELSPEARQCMEKCSQCTPFLGDEDMVISGVCGPQTLMDQQVMAATIAELKALYDANGHSELNTSPILTKIEYDATDFQVSTMSLGGVYITALTPSGPLRYRSNFRYRVQSPQISAVEMAEELIQKWEH